MQDLLSDLDLAVSVAFKAGQIIEHYRENNNWQQLDEKEDAGCPVVTNVDIEVDQYIYHKLLEQTPDYGWLSEEEVTENITEGKERVWIVDPIDGTKGFVKQDGMFAVSIALVEHGVPVIGVVYNPMRNQMMYGARGHGVFFNDQRMVTENPELQDAFLISPMRRKNKRYTQHLIEQVGQFEEVGSVAYRLGLIASGQADLTFVDHEISVWDIAAGAAMLEEQGFEVKNLDGSYINYLEKSAKIDNGIIVAKEHLLEQLEDSIKLIYNN